LHKRPSRFLRRQRGIWPAHFGLHPARADRRYNEPFERNSAARARVSIFNAAFETE